MKVEKFLKKAGVKFSKHRHPKAYTAQELAAGEHISGHQVAKSVVVHADDRRVLCVLPASCRIDLTKLAAQLGVKHCRIAEEAELEELFPDVKLGAEPPFGHLYGLETVVDEHMTRCDNITFSAGDYSKAIEMSFSEYVRLSEAKVMDFALPAS